MEQLDAAYNAFSNLEKNFKRSKKTREDYIKDKFGGDIGMGSLIITDALTSQEYTSPEDIEKLSFIQDIFNAIKARSESLNTLRSFDELLGSSEFDVIDLLCAGQERGMGVHVVGLGANNSYMYKVGAEACDVVPMAMAKYLRAYSPSMAHLMAMWSRQEVRQGDVFEHLVGDRFKKVLQ